MASPGLPQHPGLDTELVRPIEPGQLRDCNEGIRPGEVQGAAERAARPTRAEQLGRVPVAGRVLGQVAPTQLEVPTADQTRRRRPGGERRARDADQPERGEEMDERSGRRFATVAMAF